MAPTEPNPDPTSPYQVHWNTSSISNRNYDLRAIATSLSGTADPSPPFITVTVSNLLYAMGGESSPQIVENSEAGDHVATYEMYRGSGNSNQTAFERDGNLFQVIVPKGSLPVQIGGVEMRDMDPAAYHGKKMVGRLTAKRDEAGYPEVTLTPADIYRKITIPGGLENFSQGVNLIIYFRDDNRDGILDGTEIPKTQLDLFREEAGGEWSLQSFNRTLDTVNNYLRVTVSQAGTYGLFTFPKPKAVEQLMVVKSGSDAALSWQPVTEDEKGNAITVDHYNVYYGSSPAFYPDLIGGTNLLGQATSTTATDTGAMGNLNSRYYLVTAVDGAGRESYPR